MSVFWKPLRRREGTTFNEVLVAMNILAVAVFGYSLSTIGMIRQQNASDKSTIAIHLAQDKIETLQALESLADIDLCPGGGDIRISAKAGEEGIFDRCWKIGPSPLGEHLKQIDVMVFWQDYQERQVSLSTLIFSERR